MPIHVRCQQNVAPVVLLPGDPNRAQWIAQNCLTNAIRTTDYRQMFGFTGTYEGMPVSVQTTGMGGPSAAIVVEELKMLGAQVLIRVGTCGALMDNMNPGDLLLVTAACMTDGTSREIFADAMHGTAITSGYAPTSDTDFLLTALEIAKADAIPVHAGKVATLDRFYGHSEDTFRRLAKFGICAVEMEASTILTLAAHHGMKAAAMMTVSDQIFGAHRASEEIIEDGVRKMVDVALKAAKQCFS